MVLASALIRSEQQQQSSQPQQQSKQRPLAPTAELAIELAGCGIGDDGADALAQAIRDPSPFVVTALDLRDNNITSQGVAALAAAVRSRVEQSAVSAETAMSCLAVPPVAVLLLQGNLVTEEEIRQKLSMLHGMARGRRGGGGRGRQNRNILAEVETAAEAVGVAVAEVGAKAVAHAVAHAVAKTAAQSGAKTGAESQGTGAGEDTVGTRAPADGGTGADAVAHHQVPWIERARFKYARPVQEQRITPHPSPLPFIDLHGRDRKIRAAYGFERRPTRYPTAIELIEAMARGDVTLPAPLHGRRSQKPEVDLVALAEEHIQLCTDDALAGPTLERQRAAKAMHRAAQQRIVHGAFKEWRGLAQLSKKRAQRIAEVWMSTTRRMCTVGLTTWWGVVEEARGREDEYRRYLEDMAAERQARLDAALAKIKGCR